MAMSDTGDCTEQEIEHLIEGHRYCFRVAAVNRLGQSDPQEIRGEIVTKDPWGKFLVNIIIFFINSTQMFHLHVVSHR